MNTEDHEIYSVFPHVETCACYLDGETLVVAWDCVPEDHKDALRRAGSEDLSKFGSIEDLRKKRDSK